MKQKRKHRIDRKNEQEITKTMEINFEKELMRVLSGKELSF